MKVVGITTQQEVLRFKDRNFRINEFIITEDLNKRANGRGSRSSIPSIGISL